MNLELRPNFILDTGLRALAQASRDLTAFLSPDVRILFLNDAGRRALGIDAAADLLGDRFTLYICAESHSLVPPIVSEVLRTGRPAEAKVPFTHQQSREVLLATCVFTPVPTASGAVVAVTTQGFESGPTENGFAQQTTDVSSRARMMELLTGVVGHDLRNPLNAIVTGAHIVARQTEQPGVKAAMARIISSGRRMQRMIDQLLDLTRLRVGGGIPLRVSQTDLAALAEHAAQEIRTANPGWRIDIAVDGKTDGTWDADRLTQLISNLLGNAVEHGVRDAGVRIEINGTDADSVEMTISNQGAIPAAVLPLLFNPFRVVHQKGDHARGLGLGLYVTRQIALAHGGEVRAACDGSRTWFTVTLPRIRTTAANADTAAEIAAMETFASSPAKTAVTAQLFGSRPLHERAPEQYWGLFERYGRVLDAALDRQTYRRSEAPVTEDLRAIAADLADLGAGAREVAELHARALRQRTRAATFAKSQAVTAEGRLVSFELMGHLLSHYRRRAGLGGKEDPADG